MPATEARIDICWKCGAAPTASPTLSSLLESLPRPTPEIAHLLTSNDAPLDSDILIVRGIISDAEDRMHALNAQILDLRTTLAQLTQRRSETAHYLREHREILSPIRRVPPELVCDILDLSTAQYRAGPEGIPPWRLGMICRSWRQHALGYSRLWTSLSILAHPLYNGWNTRLFSELQTQLRRSATAPLDVYWVEVTRGGPDSRITELILSHSHRWRTVSFHVDVMVDRHVLAVDWIQPVRGKLDSLQGVEFVNCDRAILPDVFTSAPNLRQVVLRPDHNAGVSDLDNIPIPWAQLTSYRGGCPFAQQLDILQAAQNIADCTLEINRFYGPVQADITVKLFRLRRICLDWISLLSHIVAPNLEELSCIDCTLLSQIPALIRQVSCTLQRLVLWQCRLGDDLISVLRDLPSLTYLFLENDYHLEHHGVAFFAAMTIFETAADLCSYLKSMVYGYADWSSAASQDAFVRMARSRFLANAGHPSVRNFTSLRLLSSSRQSTHYLPPDDEITVRVRALQDEGFDVAFLGEGETTEYLRSRYL